MKTLFHVGAVAALALISVVPTAAQAGVDAAGYRAITIDTGQMDLTSAAERVRLERRIASAVERVCSVEGPTSARSAVARKACRQNAFARAQQRLDVLVARATAEQSASAPSVAPSTVD